MSGLLNSYLVDPVLRQARRVSSPALNSDEVGLASSETHGPSSPGNESRLPPAAALSRRSSLDISSSPATTSQVPYSPVTELDETQTSLPTRGAGEWDNIVRHGGGNPIIEQPSPSRYGLNSLFNYSRELIENFTSRNTMLTPEPSAAAPSPSTSPWRFGSLPSPSIAGTGRRVSADFLYRSREDNRLNQRHLSADGTNLGNTHEQVSFDHSQTTSRDGRRTSLGLAASIPDDDGMKPLRDKIHAIRAMALSSEEKAKRMHALMVADYEAFKARTETAPMAYTPLSPRFMAASVRSDSPSSYYSNDHDDLLVVSPTDRQPTYPPYQPSTETPLVDDGREGEGEEEVLLGCEHYLRNVKIQCRDCKKWYTCRHCHDLVEAHSLDRKGIRNMLCMLCGHPQKAGEYCEKCGELTAAYYCNICKLWENNTSKSTYHCLDCGICRRGEGLGKDYLHCKKCNVCISIAWIHAHRCVERATECDCPICNVWMFTSSDAVVSMKCGHYIHRQCYEEYMNTSYKCPICNRSAVNMELQWRKLDQAIQAQPMPSQYSETRAWITCNDCAARSSTSYHWLGNKCSVCDSYNTNTVKLVNSPTGEELEADSISPDVQALREMAINITASEITNLPPTVPTDGPVQPRLDADSMNISTSQDLDRDTSQTMDVSDDVPTTTLAPSSLTDQLRPPNSNPGRLTRNQLSEISHLTSSEIEVVDNERNVDREIDNEQDEEDVNFWGEGISPSTWSMPLSISPMSGWTSPGFFATRMGLGTPQTDHGRNNSSELVDGEGVDKDKIVDDDDEDDDVWSSDDSEDIDGIVEVEDGDVDEIELLGHR